MEELMTARGKPVTIPVATRLTIGEYRQLTETAHRQRTTMHEDDIGDVCGQAPAKDKPGAGGHRA